MLFQVSMVTYAKPSELKKDLNEQFREKFPNLNITLTKLRRYQLISTFGALKFTVGDSLSRFVVFVMLDKMFVNLLPSPAGSLCRLD